MRPAYTFGLTLVGILLAGIPLLQLTAKAPQRAPIRADMQEAPGTQQLFVRVQFTGKPTSCILRYEGHDLATLPADTTASPWELELPLPQLAQLELEAEIHWAEGSPENAVSITLEPAQKEPRTDTRWTGEDGALLHDLFLFSW